MGSKSKRKKGKKKSKKEKVEAPKIPLSRNRARAFGHFLLFHAIPLGGAMALIILNIKARFYGSDGRWVAALQFVAKGHEMLMQFSIVTVMTAYLQYLLVHRKSVPFGALFSAYQVTQMSYLWSPEFRAAVTASGFAGSLKLQFILLVPFSMLLAAGVGPSSAIAMQPRRVNFTVPNSRLALRSRSIRYSHVPTNLASEALVVDALQMSVAIESAGICPQVGHYLKVEPDGDLIRVRIPALDEPRRSTFEQASACGRRQTSSALQRVQSGI